MDLRVRALATAFILVATSFAATALTAGPAAAAEALTQHVDLTLTSYRDAVGDSVHGRIYVSGGQGAQHIEVVATDGSSVSQIPVAGAADLALSPDGTLLFVSVPVNDTIVEVDTTSLDVVHTFQLTLDGGCARSLAIVDGRVWFADDGGCDSQQAKLSVLDPATGQAHHVFSYPQGIYSNPQLEAVPGHHLLLVDASGSPTDVIDTDTPAVVATGPQVGIHPGRDVFSADGSSVEIAGSIYSIPDLTRTGQVPLGPDVSDVLSGDAAHLLVYGHQGLELVDRVSGDVLNVFSLQSEPLVAYHRQMLVGGTLAEIATRRVEGTLSIYLDPDPTTPAPNITADATDLVAMHPTTISGNLSDGGSPLAGVTITLTDDHATVLGQTTTDDKGDWQWAHTYTDIASEAVIATSSAVGDHKRASTRVTFNIDAPTIEATAPATVAPLADYDIHGTLTALGDPVPDSPVSYGLFCMENGGSGLLEYGQVTTDDTGHFTLTQQGECIDQRIAFSWGGFPWQVHADDTHVDTHVTWHVAHLDVSWPDEEYVGVPVDATVTYTVDGSPVAGVPVAITLHPAGSADTVDLSGTTDADGQILVHFTPTTAGYWHLYLRHPGDDTTTTAEGDFATLAKSVATSFTATPDHDHVVVGEAVTVFGDVTREHGPVDGITLQVTATDSATSAERTFSVTTDAHGHFSFQDTPASPGATAYDVVFEGDTALYPWAESTTQVVVQRRRPVLTLATDQDSYDAGDTATIRLTSDTPLPGVVVVQENAAGTDKVTQLYYGGLPADGLTLEHRMLTTQTIHVDALESPITEAASTQLTIPVRMSLSTRALSPRRVTSGGVAIFGRSSHPRFRASEVPGRANVCLQLQVQRRTVKGWRAVVTAYCRTADVRGDTTTWRLMNPHRAGVDYRERVTFGGDERNLPSQSSWVRFRFAAS